MKEIPMSNYGPCCCYAQKESRITNIPDKMQRPARREVDVNSIGKNMKYSDKGYKFVEPSADTVTSPVKKTKREMEAMEKEGYED